MCTFYVSISIILNIVLALAFMSHRDTLNFLLADELQDNVALDLENHNLRTVLEALEDAPDAAGFEAVVVVETPEDFADGGVESFV